jgi:hypothetical protein
LASQYDLFRAKRKKREGRGGREMERRKTRVGSARGGERGMETEPKTETDDSAACHGAVFSYIIGRSNDEQATES